MFHYYLSLVDTVCIVDVRVCVYLGGCVYTPLLIISDND